MLWRWPVSGDIFFGSQRNGDVVEDPGKHNAGPSSQREVAVEAVNLTRIYLPFSKAVDNITFSVYEGEIFGLLGPNGAGKTTAIEMITTLTKPASGVLRVFGLDVRTNPELVRSMLGYVPQSVSVDADLSAYENLLSFSKLFFVSHKDRKARIKEALEYVGLEERADDLVKHYSGGMMRRLGDRSEHSARAP